MPEEIDIIMVPGSSRFQDSCERTLWSITDEVATDEVAKAFPASDDCPIHPHCLYKKTCDETICRLFFREQVRFGDLVHRVRTWTGPLHTRRDARVFLEANRDLVKTTHPYSWLCAHIYWALQEVG